MPKLLSIVSGTYNRHTRLMRMMHSVREQLLPGIDYEFVIVDGGSTDGTLDWLRLQDDVRLIEDGALLGAISAFTRGAHAAAGEYVVMANDDITFAPYALLTAVSWLETHPTCGIVAFEDNRPPNGPTGYSVQMHAARFADGTMHPQPYAQVGMVRRALGGTIGWWGADDPGMAGARTYGGDNYLSSRVWEAGWTVDVVKGCRIHDDVAQDDMRKQNTESAKRDGQIYHSRFADGARFGEHPVALHREPDRLRILYLPLHEGRFPASRIHKTGLRNALKQLGIVAEYDYVLRSLDQYPVTDEILKLADALQPDVFYTQIHQATPGQVQLMAKLRAAHPNMVCLNWNGDYWPEKALHPDTLDLTRYYDLAMLVNYSLVETYREHGIPAAYVQDGSEEPQDLPAVPEYDVLFIGNSYSGSRKALGEMLKSLPYKVGLYGNGWGDLADGETYYRWDLTHALIANAKIVVGDMQFPDAEAYVSNRFFNTLYAGALHLQQHVPNFEARTGIKEGIHYAEWHDLEDLRDKIDLYLTDSKDRNRIKRNGQRLARQHHTYAARVRQVFSEVLPEVANVVND